MTAHEFGGFVLWLFLWGGFCGVVGYLVGLDVRDRARARRKARRDRHGSEEGHPSSNVRLLPLSTSLNARSNTP